MTGRIIVAIDSFKGCLASVEANQAAAEGIRECLPEVELVQIPVSDGGEGWLEAFRSAVGGSLVEINVFDPMMRSVEAQYLIKDDMAVIEMAKASGLTLLSSEERNPMIASSYGTGQLLVDAVQRGCRQIIVGLGGSATSDCGTGMLRAIIDAFAENGSWDDVHALDDVRFTIATDVTNPLCGEGGAAHVFAPQKGALLLRWSLPSMPEPNASLNSLPGISASTVSTFLVQVRQAAWAMLSYNIWMPSAVQV